MNNSENVQSTIDRVVGRKDFKRLKPMHARFVEEYLVDLNPAKAYQRAGYQSKNAAQAAWGLLHRKDVQRAIQKAQEERQRRCHIDQDRVLQELAKIAFANIKSMVRWDDQGFTVKNSDNITEEDAAAISEVEIKFNDFGARAKIKLYDKRAALVDIGNHLGIFDRKDKPKDPVEEAQKICRLVQEMNNTMGGNQGTRFATMTTGG